MYHQIYPEGIRHIRADKRVNEWKSPGGCAVVSLVLSCVLNSILFLAFFIFQCFCYMFHHPYLYNHTHTDRQEKHSKMRSESKAGGDSIEWGRVGVLRDGPGALVCFILFI